MSATKQDTPKSNKKQQKATRAQTSKTRPTRKTNGVRKTNASITAPEALQLLESAVSYCQQAGLEIYAGNAIEGLRFYLPQAKMIETADGGAAFVLDERAPTPRTMGATF